MARKVKGQLPSGSVRVQVYDYTDSYGKRHYKSFTADTRSKAQALANEWKYNRKEEKENITLKQAIKKYIDMKREVLSPSTTRGYESILRCIDSYPISNISIRDLDNSNLQTFVSKLSIGHSSKYVKNFFGLISATLSAFAPEFNVRVQLPKKTHVETYTPTNDDIQKLLNACKTIEEKIGILFGAVGFMRRGEACAVLYKDINKEDGTISITKSMVLSENNEWITKEPKTYESYRTVMMPKYVFDLINETGRKTGTVLNMNPTELYESFSRALKRSGLPNFRFHDLRHHAASYAHTNGINDRYIEKMGGWKPNSTVLKKVYQNVIDEELVKSQKRFIENQSFST